MKRLTILHTIETGGPGGAETVVRDLAAHLDPARFRSVVVLPGGTWLPQRLRDIGISVSECRSTSWRDLTLIRCLTKVIRSENVDVIHSHLPGQNFYASLAGMITGRPVISTYHGSVELDYNSGIKGRVKLWCAGRLSTVVIVVCDQMVGRLTDWGFPNSKIFRIYNGVDVGHFRGGDRERARKGLGVDADVPVIGVIGNIRIPKGHEYLIRAATQVLARFPSARFFAAGEHQAGLSERLMSLVEELGLAGRFQFLGFRSDVADLLAAFDILAIPSTNEGFPLIALEAMAARRPVVATRCGGIEEIIQDGETGFLVPVASSEALAKCLCAVLGDRAAARRAADAGGERIERLFSQARMISQYEALYSRLGKAGPE